MSKKTNLKTWLEILFFLLAMANETFAEQLCPLQVGQRCEYRRTDNDGNEWTSRMELNGHMTIDSLDYFYLQVWNYDNDSAFEDRGYVRSTEEELYVYNPNGEDYLEFQKAPIGTKWSFYQEHESGYNYKVTEIVDINEVNVPYGEFDEAYVHRNYRCVDPNDVNESTKSPDWYGWVVPGIGYVKEMDYWVDYNAPWTEELVSVCNGDFDSNSAVITNPWLGLTDTGDSYRLAGYGSFAEATRIYALPRYPVTEIGNVLGVECLILTISGHGNNPATEYYHDWIAQDTCGNIRVLRVTGRDNEGPIEWQADSASEAPILLPSDPCVGQRFPLFVEGEYHEVVALDQNVPQMSTGLGPYSGCMQYRWSNGIDDTDDKWFCPNVGAVKEEWNDGGTNGWERTTQSPISNHLYSIEIAQGWDYNYPDTPLVYEITLRAQTDPNVELVEFNSPAGNTFGIPNEPESCSGGICTRYGCDDGTCYWEYHAEFPSEANLAEYGDGNYIVTVHYEDDSNDQTTAWFGIPATSDPIHQITQEPILTFPDHNGTTICPVTFEWQACADSNANLIILSLENQETGQGLDNAFTPDANSWPNVKLPAGLWEVDLSFGQRYLPVPNNDGVAILVSKYSESDYWFTTTPPRGDFEPDCDVDSVDFSVLALSWLLADGQAGYDPNCDISIPADDIIDGKDLKIFTNNWLFGK